MFPGFHEGFCAIPYKDEGVYIAGGYDEFGDRKRLQYMDLSDGSITTLDHMSENRTEPACAPYQNGFVVAGGWSGDSQIIGDVKPNRKVEYFDFETGNLCNIFTKHNTFDSIAQVFLYSCTFNSPMELHDRHES